MDELDRLLAEIEAILDAGPDADGLYFVPPAIIRRVLDWTCQHGDPQGLLDVLTILENRRL